jgi:hypothetical protein
MGHNKDIFAGEGRDQFVLEGIVISLYTFGCGIALALIHWLSKFKYPLLKHVLIIIALAIFVVCSMELWNLYKFKTRWYNLSSTLPPQLSVWLTSAVKKNSGFLKRFFRLGEYVLFELKDWEGFQKKFNSLIVEYGQRLLEEYREHRNQTLS